MKTVSVERAGELIILLNDSGETLRRTIAGVDMISSTEHDDGTQWKKVEAIYFDPTTTTIKVVYHASGFNRLISKVAASSDDCRRSNGAYSTFLLSSQIRVGTWYVPVEQTWYGSGMRFLNVTIPKGSVINEAYLTVRAIEDCPTTVCRTRISAEGVDDAVTFANDGAAFDTRWATRTTARVDWDVPAFTAGADYNSPDIKAVIQEIVNRANWVSGNDIVIFWDDLEHRSDGYATRVTYDYDTSATYAPKLVVYHA